MLQPQLFTLSKLLNENLFIIPDYQRSYSWQTKQREALFDDIKYLWTQKKLDANADHFMSTLVCLKKKPMSIGSTVFTKYDVVDGQQRLTTLIILLKTIEMKLKKGKDKNDLKDILVKQDDSTTPILLMNHDEKRIFKDFIIRNKIPSNDKRQELLSDQMLVEAIYECKRFVEDWSKTEDVEKLYSLLKNNLYFILHTMDTEKSVYKTFEVLNSRGLTVEWLDKLKCLMMGILFEAEHTDTQIDEMHSIWSSIYKEMGLKKDLGEMAMRFLALLDNDYNSIKSEEDSALELYAKCGKDAQIVLDISRQIECLVKDLKALKKLVVSDVLLNVQHPRFMAICIIKSNFSQKEKNKLMEAWEHSTFKIFGLERKDSRYHKGDYISLGKKIYKGQIQYQDALENIYALSKDCKIDIAVDELKQIDIYHEWAEEFKYIMYLREIELAGSKSRIATKQWKEIWVTPTTDSIEHILSQSSPNAVDSIRDAKRNKIFKHRLGNLLVIAANKNSSLGKITDPAGKIPYYNDLFIEKEVAKIIQKKGWSKKVVQEREEELCQWMIKKWGK